MDKQIFDKKRWISELKEKLKKSKLKQSDVVEGLHYLGDIIEDIISMTVDQEDQIDELKKTLVKHRHLGSGEVVKPL